MENVNPTLNSTLSEEESVFKFVAQAFAKTIFARDEIEKTGVSPSVINLANYGLNVAEQGVFKWAAINKKLQLDLICYISKLLSSHKEEVRSGVQSSLTVEEVLESLERKSGVFGDNREEIENVIDFIIEQIGGKENPTIDKIRNSADRIVLVVRKSDLKDYNNNPDSPTYEITNKDLKERQIVIAGERFPLHPKLRLGGQRTANSLGTGFFYREDTIITVAHVLFPFFMDVSMDDIRFVKSFYVRERRRDGNPKHSFDRRVTIPKSKVYKPVRKHLVYKENYDFSSHDEDWAVIQVEPENREKYFDKYHSRLFEEEIILKKGRINPETRVYGLGHGLALPGKISPCGKAVEGEERKYIKCSLDFFSGSSGSPIFSADKHELMGILVRGSKDFYFGSKSGSKVDIYNPDDLCVIPGVLSDESAMTEVCQKVEYFEKALEPRPSEDVKESYAINPYDLIPYTSLQKDDKTNQFILSIYFSTKDRKVFFPSYPEKHGAITVIKCYLDTEESSPVDNRILLERSKGYKQDYYLRMPDEDLRETNETIEIRVLDLKTDVYHQTVLNFTDFVVSRRDTNKNVPYIASRRPKAFYTEDNNDLVEVSLGFFKDGGTEFRKSKFVDIDLKQSYYWSLKFTEVKEYLEVEVVDDLMTSNTDSGVRIEFSEFEIKKTGSIGGRNPKPNRFIGRHDMIQRL